MNVKALEAARTALIQALDTIDGAHAIRWDPLELDQWIQAKLKND